MKRQSKPTTAAAPSEPSATVKPKETTLGGVQKAKFAPTIPSSRRVKSESSESKSTEQKSHASSNREFKPKPRARLPIDNNISGPVSGPFSLGPSISGVKPKSSAGAFSAGPSSSSSSFRSSASKIRAGPKSSESNQAKVQLGNLSSEGKFNPVFLQKKSTSSAADANESKVEVADEEIDNLMNNFTTILQDQNFFSENELYLFQLPQEFPLAFTQKDDEECEDCQLGRIDVYESGKIIFHVGSVTFQVASTNY